MLVIKFSEQEIVGRTAEAIQGLEMENAIRSDCLSALVLMETFFDIDSISDYFSTSRINVIDIEVTLESGFRK